MAAGNYSSRFAGAVAGTAHLAAMKVRAKLARIAAVQLGCDAAQVVFAGGKVFAAERAGARSRGPACAGMRPWRRAWPATRRRSTRICRSGRAGARSRGPVGGDATVEARVARDPANARTGSVGAGAAERTIPFARAASSAHWAPALLPAGMEPGLRETVFWTPEQLAAPDEQDRVNTSAAYGFAFDVCALEIDRDTGKVRIDRYVTTHDAGRLLNPALADGQIRGGFAQGLGAALMEQFVYSADGAFLSGTFADYLVPTAMEVPEPVILHLETPSPFTPLGAKGVGEGNNMSTPVCIANAIADALGPTVDPEAITLPLTPAKILALLGMPDPAPTGTAADARPAEAARGVLSRVSRWLGGRDG